MHEPPPLPSLFDLGQKYRSDKLRHGYLPHYDVHFRAFRDESMTLLEIGVGGYGDPESGGRSLKMWRDYFSRGRIIGMDASEKKLELGDRITVVRARQDVESDLRRVADQYGPFRLIVDDGSHVNEHRRISFEVLFPYLADGGLYVIEDLHTSYLTQRYGGSWSDPDAPTTTMGLLKGLVHGLNYQYIPHREPAPLDSQITGLAFYPKLAFIMKGRNEQTIGRNDREALDRENTMSMR